MTDQLDIQPDRGRGVLGNPEPPPVLRGQRRGRGRSGPRGLRRRRRQRRRDHHHRWRRRTTSTTMGDGGGDAAIATFGAGLELLAAQTYTAALEAAGSGALGDVPPAVAEFATTAQAHHQAASDALAEAAGGITAGGRPRHQGGGRRGLRRGEGRGRPGQARALARAPGRGHLPRGPPASWRARPPSTWSVRSSRSNASTPRSCTSRSASTRCRTRSPPRTSRSHRRDDDARHGRPCGSARGRSWHVSATTQDPEAADGGDLFEAAGLERRAVDLLVRGPAAVGGVLEDVVDAEGAARRRRAGVQRS